MGHKNDSKYFFFTHTREISKGFTITARYCGQKYIYIFMSTRHGRIILFQHWLLFVLNTNILFTACGIVLINGLCMQTLTASQEGNTRV